MYEEGAEFITQVADDAIEAKYLALVAGSLHDVKLPAAANATKFIGVSASVSGSENQLTVAVEGIFLVTSDGSGTIANGDYLVIANSDGQVKKVTPADGATLRQVIGIARGSAPATAGALVPMLIQPQIYIGA